MASCCKNILEITGKKEDVARFKKQAVSNDFVEEGCDPESFSFESLFPAPEALNVKARNHTDEYDSYYGDTHKVLDYQWVKDVGINNEKELRAYLDEFKPEYRKVADLAKLNISAHGYPDFCRWRIGNWGFKNDAYSSALIKSESRFISYRFSTRKPPKLCLANVSKLYPELHFKLIFEEVSTGSTGYATYKRGKTLRNIISECWRGVHPDDMEHWDCYVDGYEYDLYQFIAKYGYVSDPDRVVRSVEECERIMSGEDDESDDSDD